MRLRLYHHVDGARVAYREAGAGPALVLLHSLGLTHREWEPIVEPLAARFHVVAPDLPLHGDSEDRPRHPYTREWFTEVVGGFCAEVGGPRASVVGHDIGAELALRMIIDGIYTPARLVLESNRLHREMSFPAARRVLRAAAGFGSLPAADLLVSHAARLMLRPRLGERLSHQRNPAARDLMRHAFADLGGNTNRVRAWAKFTRRWPFDVQRDLLDSYSKLTMPVLLLWAEDDPMAPLEWAREALDLIPGAQLRTLPGTGFLVAYDDPVSLARELISFCG
ncbi:MAG: alpha/beta fold hydrolase [Solirubrobacteraceae bacterium]